MQAQAKWKHKTGIFYVWQWNLFQQVTEEQKKYIAMRGILSKFN